MSTHVELVDRSADALTWRVVTEIVCRAAKHGTLSAYKNAGCRCPGASDKAAAYEKRRRTGQVLREVDATGSVRRLQALACVGWSSTDLAAFIPRNSVSLSQLRRGVFAYTSGSTAKAVTDVYEKLAKREGPSRRARMFAERHGYPSPEAWTADTIDDPQAEPWSWDTTDKPVVDEVAVQRALAGEHVSLPRDERGEALVRLIAAGLTPSEAGRRLRLSGASTRALLDEAS